MENLHKSIVGTAPEPLRQLPPLSKEGDLWWILPHIPTVPITGRYPCPTGRSVLSFWQRLRVDEKGRVIAGSNSWMNGVCCQCVLGVLMGIWQTYSVFGYATMPLSWNPKDGTFRPDAAWGRWLLLSVLRYTDGLSLRLRLKGEPEKIIVPACRPLLVFDQWKRTMGIYPTRNQASAAMMDQIQEEANAVREGEEKVEENPNLQEPTGMREGRVFADDGDPPV